MITWLFQLHPLLIFISIFLYSLWRLFKSLSLTLIFIIFLVNWFLSVLSVTYKSASFDYLIDCVLSEKRKTHTKNPPKNKPQKSKQTRPQLCFLNTFLFCLSVLISFLVSRKLRDLKEDRIPCVMPLYMILLSNYSSYLEFQGDIGRAWKYPVFFALVVATLWHPQTCTHTS